MFVTAPVLRKPHTPTFRMKLCVIAAVGEDGAMGQGGDLPWGRVDDDMAFFRQVTRHTSFPGMVNAVIMGRRTWLSLKGQSLPGRLMIVLSRAPPPRDSGTLWASSLREALDIAQSTDNVDRAFVIGGVEPLQEALVHPLLHKVFVTVIGGSFPDADVFMPALLPSALDATMQLTKRRQLSPLCTCHVWRRRPSSVTTAAPKSQEWQYLHLVQEIMDKGALRMDRTRVGTRAVFGRHLRFSLEHNVFPLFTSKRVFWKGVALELLWFIAGRTDAKELAAAGVRIWDGNGSREFLDSRGLAHHEEGDLGPVYGFQWRHFGAEYKGPGADYSGAGVDQLKAVIDTLRANPCDRRIVMSAWNPADLHKMALPPCHMFCQFYANDGELSCMVRTAAARVCAARPRATCMHVVFVVCLLADVPAVSGHGFGSAL